MDVKSETITTSKTVNHEKVINTKVEKITAMECQYQIVKRKDAKTETNIDELLKKIQPPKSFLYRNQVKSSERVTTSYVPMDVGQKKRKLFRLSYDYPSFDLSRFRFSKTFEPKVDFNDRGYYQIKKDEEIQKATSVQDIFEDHLYEDLNYNDIERNRRNSTTNAHAKFSIMNFQGIFNSIKKPFFKKNEEKIVKTDVEVKVEEKVLKDDPVIYENDEGVVQGPIYDIVKVKHTCGCNKNNGLPTAQVEDYMEPIQHQRETDYCDVSERQREETFLSYLLSIFENTFGMKKETNETTEEDVETTDIKWSDEKNKMADKSNMADQNNMADRPLPVPIDKEVYYMNLDRRQAEELLMGQPDGAFILRPSSQPTHVYTLSVSCSAAVHNVGVRRRPDGRLALGFARKGERNFATIPDLIRHHKRRRLLLVSGGGVLGGVTLTEPPLYYHTPSGIPVNNPGCLKAKACCEH